MVVVLGGQGNLVGGFHHRVGAEDGLVALGGVYHGVQASWGEPSCSPDQSFSPWQDPLRVVEDGVVSQFSSS